MINVSVSSADDKRVIDGVMAVEPIQVDEDYDYGGGGGMEKLSCRSKVTKEHASVKICVFT